jgi:hypothetical protein
MEKFLLILGAIGLIIVLSLIATLSVMWLWNDLMPTLFGLRQITFVQALELSVLSSLLFKTSSISSSKK